MIYAGTSKTSLQTFTTLEQELMQIHNCKYTYDIEYNNGVEAFKEEQRLLKEYAMYRYYGEKVFLYGGDSELFTVDIMNLKEREE